METRTPPRDQTISWILTGFGDEIDPEPFIQVSVLQALGASHIEVRSAWGTNVLALSETQLEELRSLFTSKGIKVSAIASPIGKVDVELPVAHEVKRLRRAITAARTLGAHYIRVFSFYYPGRSPATVRNDVIARMGALAVAAEEAGVTLLHENEKDIFGDIPSRIADIIESVGSPALKVAWDSANFVQAGVRPFVDGYDLLRPYVEYLHIKDASLADGNVRLAGEGDGEMQPTFEALRDSGYDGFVSLEPHLASASKTGGFSGPVAFGEAARAFAHLAGEIGIGLL